MNTQTLLAHVLVQLAVIIGCARLGGLAFKRIGQPMVCGEIASGLILGPSLLGALLPGVSSSIFTHDTQQAFTAMSEVGLVLLLFLIGIDFDFGHLKEHKGKPFVISAVGITVPFALGLGVGYVIYPEVGQGRESTFALFIALTLAITALPIMGRILIELGLNRTPLGALTITSAAIDDAVGWTLLALITSIATTGANWGKVGLMMAETIAFAAFLFVVARPLLKRWGAGAVARGQGKLTQTDLAVLLVLLIGCALVTHKIGIFAIFGAFMLGAVFHDAEEFRAAVLARMNDFVAVFFLPIFFTYTGLRTDMGSMSGATLWAMCGLVVAAGIVGKLGGCTLAAKATGLPWRDSGMVGVLMNARALMALIVINVGMDAGLLTKGAFFMLVAMAVVTTFMTAPLLNRLTRGAPRTSLATIPPQRAVAGDGKWQPEPVPTAGTAVAS